MRISDWSSDVCSSDLNRDLDHEVIEFFWLHARQHRHLRAAFDLENAECVGLLDHAVDRRVIVLQISHADRNPFMLLEQIEGAVHRSAEHTSELQSLMRISYAVFCLKKKK